MGGSKNGIYRPLMASLMEQNDDNPMDWGLLWVWSTTSHNRKKNLPANDSWLEGQKVAQSDVAPGIIGILGPPIQVFVGFVVEGHGTCPGKLEKKSGS